MRVQLLPAYTPTPELWHRDRKVTLSPITCRRYRHVRPGLVSHRLLCVELFSNLFSSFE